MASNATMLAVTARAIAFKIRDEDAYFYPNTTWRGRLLVFFHRRIKQHPDLWRDRLAVLRSAAGSTDSRRLLVESGHSEEILDERSKLQAR